VVDLPGDHPVRVTKEPPEITSTIKNLCAIQQILLNDSVPIHKSAINSFGTKPRSCETLGAANSAWSTGRR
jgi:hypothetical protein